MAKFRKNHGADRNPFMGLTIRIFLLIGIALVLMIIGYRGWHTQQAQNNSPNLDELLFEDFNRSHLVPIAEHLEVEVVNHLYYSLGYVERYEQAAWVCYVLNKSELKIPNVKRYDRYLEDPEVSTGSSVYHDYTRSGYSRGHLAPAGDMAFNEKAILYQYSN